MQKSSENVLFNLSKKCLFYFIYLFRSFYLFFFSILFLKEIVISFQKLSNITIWWNITLYKKVFNCMFLSFHVGVLEWIHTLQLPECQGTLCSKQAQNLKFEWLSFRLRTKWLWVRFPLESLKKILLNPKKAGENGFSWL